MFDGHLLHHHLDDPVAVTEFVQIVVEIADLNPLRIAWNKKWRRFHGGKTGQALSRQPVTYGSVIQA